MRHLFSFILLVLLCGAAASGLAQADSSRRLKVAVFAPVYLDSAFSGNDYRLGSNSIPRYMVPGLDFYHGVMMAVDSLNKSQTPVDIRIYDSKGKETSPAYMAADPDLAEASLIIASFNTRSEVKPLADFALAHRIPLVSATYPNDAGVTANPYFIMLNPRITTHIAAIHQYIQHNYPADNIIVFRRKGGMEDLILNMLNDLNKKTPGTQVRYKPVWLSDTASVYQVNRHLDSLKQNIVLCGTLNENFSMNLARGLADARAQATVIGMPTWDGISGIGKGIDMIYSTPYNLTRTGPLSQQLDAAYKAVFSIRPSDMFYKGFESVYHFTSLLVNHPVDFITHLSDNDALLFDEFDIQPATTAASHPLPDFLENKKIYFIRKIDNKLQSVQ